MRNGQFTMYDDDGFQVAAPSTRNTVSGSTSYHPVRFPTKNITSPIVLMYGDEDSLVDIDLMLKELPESTTYVKRLRVRVISCDTSFSSNAILQGYEHLDILWGDQVDKDVIPLVAQTLAHYCRNPEISAAVAGVDWGTEDGTSTLASIE